jgi:GNAT superfamily N-acetyltransferase
LRYCLRYRHRVEIREARTDDAAPVAALLGELGYPTSEEEAAFRLNRLREEPQTLVLVVDVNGAVAALGGIRSEWPLEYGEPWGRVIALVVGEQHRGHAIGARLLDALEAEATSRGCVAVVLTSGKHRHEAHAFYERRGYEATGKRFAKVLSTFNQ